jgi:hypothetical protein
MQRPQSAFLPPDLIIPPPGVAMMKIMAANGNVVLKHPMDVRISRSMHLNSTEVSLVVSGLLASKSYERSERAQVDSTTTNLIGKYTIEYPNAAPTTGSIQATVSSCGKSVTPSPCNCTSGPPKKLCGCR